VLFEPVVTRNYTHLFTPGPDNLTPALVPSAKAIPVDWSSHSASTARQDSSKRDDVTAHASTAANR
jgi:hypothetical protein